MDFFALEKLRWRQKLFKERVYLLEGQPENKTEHKTVEFISFSPQKLILAATYFFELNPFER